MPSADALELHQQLTQNGPPMLAKQQSIDKEHGIAACMMYWCNRRLVQALHKGGLTMEMMAPNTQALIIEVIRSQAVMALTQEFRMTTEGTS